MKVDDCSIHRRLFRSTIPIFIILVLFVACPGDRENPMTSVGDDNLVVLAKPTGTNNLSFPVIWAEGVQKTLPGTPGMTPDLNGVWWYWWGMEGEDPNIVPLSCLPDPDDPSLCDDGIPGSATGAEPGPGWVKSYVQKDANNVWQAESVDWSASAVEVDWIDWGDNLESVDWYTTSQVRTEVVLFQDLDVPMLEYEMRHVSGWGIDEVHGVAASGDPAVAIEGPGTSATVYSPCARLTIQKLLVNREDIHDGYLIWVPGGGWTTLDTIPDMINPPIFNMAVYQGEDGPGYYSAEINVKGRIIYGYTWNVRRLNDGAGDYRITYSFDTDCGGVPLNTFFIDGVSEIIVPIEEISPAETDGTGGGAVGVLDFANNLTYIDVRILGRSGGGGDKPHDGGGGGGGGGH